MAGEHDLLRIKVGELVEWTQPSQPPTLAKGSFLRGVSVIDLDTGEKIRSVEEADSRTGRVVRFDSPPQLDPTTGDARRHVETRRIRIFWVETD